MTGHPARSLVVVSAGISEPSASRLLADRVTAAVERHLHDAGTDPMVQHIELRAHARDLASHLLTGFPSPVLQEALDAVLTADGLVAVTPVYSASYSGLFKLFFDVVDRDAFAGMPVLLAATGGTPRHSLVIEHAMRPLFAYLRAAPVATGVYAATEDWGQGAVSVDGSLLDRIDRAAGELAVAMVSRATSSAGNAAADPAAFEDVFRPG